LVAVYLFLLNQAHYVSAHTSLGNYGDTFIIETGQIARQVAAAVAVPNKLVSFFGIFGKIWDIFLAG